jgi:hypothetical protein
MKPEAISPWGDDADDADKEPVRAPSPLPKVAESAVITLAVPAIGWLVDTSDPFFLDARFPWIAFAPVLVALRHGFAHGFACAVVLDVALVAAWRTRLVPISGFPGEVLVALVALAMIAGQFSDVWIRRGARAREKLVDLRRYADELARTNVLLELSHDRVDEQLERSTSTLRDALVAVRELSPPVGQKAVLARAAAMMDIFAGYCGLEVGEIFAVDRGRVGERWAVLGRPAATTKGDDPLVRRALRSGKLMYVPAATLPDRERAEAVQSQLLAAIPFVDASGVVRAVLCVHAMPFVSFERRNLQTMVTLAGQLADLVAHSRGATQRIVEPGFELRLLRALRDVREHKAEGTVACVRVRRGVLANEIVDAVLEAAPKRTAPFPTRSSSGECTIHFLLPGPAEAARTLEESLAASVKGRFGKPLERLGARFAHHILSPNDTPVGVLWSLERKVTHDESVLESTSAR